MDDFLKQIKQGVDQMVAGTQKELTEFQLKSRRKDLQDERTRKLAVLGEKVYQGRSSGNVPLADLAEEVAAVEALDATLADLEKQLDALRPPPPPPGDPPGQ